MPHKFIDISEIPKRTGRRMSITVESLFKIAEALSPGKAVIVDVSKLNVKLKTAYYAAKKLIKNGELPGVEATIRGGELYLSRG